MSQMQSSGILTSFSQPSRSQSKNPSAVFFKTTLRESGIILSPGEELPNFLNQEQALVVRDLEKQFEHQNNADSIEKFLKGLKMLINKEKYMKKALLPTQLKKKVSEGEVELPQESIFRIFLKVDHIQNEIIEIILNVIADKVTDENQDTSWLRLLLSQLRYLPHIKNAQGLTVKLLDTIEIATFPSQLEILDSIPEIIPDSEYTATAKQLSELLDTNEELSGAIIDCLNALNLDSDVRSHVQNHILSRILASASIKTFPILLEFLVADNKAQDLPATLAKIRNALDTIMSSSNHKNKEKESGKIVIWNRLQTLTTTPKLTSDAWIKMITNIKVHTDHKPIDLLLLFMLHSNAKLRKRLIEMIFRKRIKDGLFKCSLLEQLFAKYFPQQLLRDYFTTIVEIGCSLLRNSHDPIIIEFASTLFKLLFRHEYTLVIFRQELLDNLILLTGASNHNNVSTVLNIIHGLLEDIEKIQHHTVLLMRLLEQLDIFELKDVKMVFEILSTLACSDESLSGLKEEIHMIIRKQLSSCKRSIKHRGIISAVVMAKHIATINEEQSEVSLSDDSMLSLSHLQGAAKEAASILELANTSTSGTPELMGLYYDQLAAMLIKSENLDKTFIAWLYETITNNFQSVYITENISHCIDDLELCMQYNLNLDEEIDTPIAVNIAELTLKSEHSPILIMAPHFRLLRLLHYRHNNGDLSSIDALLGCGVVLPKIESVDNLEFDQIKQVADCLFHCINWFREIISGFVTQKAKKLRQKVIQRLSDLIELEGLLNKCLLLLPQHRLPLSYFDAFAQLNKHTMSPKKDAGKRPRKKLKVSDNPDESVPSTSRKTRKILPEEVPQVGFREMDTDIVILLKYPLDIGDEMPSSDKITLQITQLNFILKDFVSKLNLLTTGRDLGLSHLNVVTPDDLVTDCVVILPNVHKHFAVVNRKIEELLKESDGCYDTLDMLSEETNELKTCFGLVIESLSLLFHWSGFQHSKRLDLLKGILKTFHEQDSNSQSDSINHLIMDLINRLNNYIDHCLYINHGVNSINTMEALYAITPRQEIRSKISKASEQLLNRTWYTSSGALASGKSYSLSVDLLIKAYLSSASVKTLCGLVATLQEQAPTLKLKNDRLEMLKSVDKLNFYIFYRTLWNRLHERIKIEIQSLTNNQHLILWRTVALTMQGLMMVAKEQSTRSNLICFLKKSTMILKIFLSDGVPMLEIMLKSKPDQVVEILKTIQSTTRYVHHMCCYSKLKKDGSLMTYVPQFRLTLETLVYRVKAALVANGCSAAFWMGNLKNRDLEGVDILSQSTITRSDDEEAEELPSDEDSDGDLFGEADESGNSRSASEVYE